MEHEFPPLRHGDLEKLCVSGKRTIISSSYFRLYAVDSCAELFAAAAEVGRVLDERLDGGSKKTQRDRTVVR